MFPDLGLFQGNRAQLAMLFTWLIAFEWLMLFFSPWLVALGNFHNRDQSFLAALPVPISKLCFIDVFACISAGSFWKLLKRLNARIATGGSEAAFLDEIRYQVVSLILGLLLLMISAVIFLGSRHHEQSLAARHMVKQAVFGQSGTCAPRKLL